MSSETGDVRTGPSGLVRRAITVWAAAGGVLLLGVVLVNVISVVSGIVWKPFSGDFELTQVGVAVAVFAFLPYCQLTGSNVSAEIFTMGASPRWIALFTVLAGLVALGFSALLMTRMYWGMLDQKAYGYTTTILQFPHWLAFIPILISLALLVVAAVITLMESLRQTVRA